MKNNRIVAHKMPSAESSKHARRIAVRSTSNYTREQNGRPPGIHSEVFAWPPGSTHSRESAWPPESTHSNVPAKPKAYDKTHAIMHKDQARARISGSSTQRAASPTPARRSDAKTPHPNTPRSISSPQPVEVFSSYDFPIGLRPVPTVSPHDFAPPWQLVVLRGARSACPARSAN